jgi:hypothetical protein
MATAEDTPVLPPGLRMVDKDDSQKLVDVENTDNSTVAYGSTEHNVAIRIPMATRINSVPE